MSYIVDHAVPSSVNLQMNLCSASAMTDEIRRGHHPITCKSDLRLENDGRFACRALRHRTRRRPHSDVHRPQRRHVALRAAPRKRRPMFLAENIDGVGSGGLVWLLLVMLIIVAIVYFVRRM